MEVKHTKKIHNRALYSVAIGLLCLLSASTIYAQGAFLVIGNRTDTSVSYQISMVASSSGSVITLTATLTKNGVPLANAPISFYRCDIGSLHTGANATALSTVVTNALGIAAYNDATTQPGLYHHVPEYSAL